MPEVVVKKFGGSSVATLDKIRDVARIIKEASTEGKSIVVVVSAMGNTTDDLVNKVNSICGEMSSSPEGSSLEQISQEMKIAIDMILSSGEQISAGLLALELIRIGLKAEPLTGWQIPIFSNTVHSEAKIESINTFKINEMMDSGIIPVIAGFQGIANNRITTFGRGGSDTTAVAIASALRAKECLIYTDVEGIYSSDPRKIANAIIIDEISYEECLEVAASGGKVMHPRAVEIGMKNSIPIKVLPTKDPNASGTKILGKESFLANTKEGNGAKAVEHESIVGISADEDQVLVSLEGIENVPGVASAIFGQLQGISINADLIVQNISRKSRYSDLSFTVKEADADAVINALQGIDKVVYTAFCVYGDVAKISVVGNGLKRYSNIAKKMFATLAKQGINVLLVSTSEIKISVLIKRQFAKIALDALHKEFIE